MRGETVIKKRISERTRRDWIFVAILLAYPVLQFVITWGFVNIGSVLLAFQRVDSYGNVEWTFDQFGKVIRNIFEFTVNGTGVTWLNNKSVIILNSLGYAAVTIFVSLPLSLVFSYFLQKNMPFANVFRVIFFLPNIIPIVALVIAYNMPFNSTYGYMYKILEAMGISGELYDSWPKSQLMVYLYCIWAGLGYNIVLMSGAIGRIPKEIFESAQLDGAGYFVEFTKITIPLIWPTIITLVVLGMTNVLTLYLQPYLLVGEGNGPIYSIAMDIFVNTANFNTSAYSEMAAEGLMFSVIWAPIVMLVRSKMSKKYSEVDF